MSAWVDSLISQGTSTPQQVKEDGVRRVLHVTILGLIAIAAFSIRLFSVIRYESVIHEFDPWFNYRASRVLLENGFYEFWNWFDEKSWYPLGRAVGPTVYPGLMMTSALLHKILTVIGVPTDIKDVCVFMGPSFAAFTSMAMYKLTGEIKDRRTGLLAAGFIAIVPGYISRSVAGSFDNECIAIFILTLGMWLWIKSIKTGSPSYGALTATVYFYMVASWGGYAFLTNLIPLHVLVLLVMGRFDQKIYAAYCSYFVIGTIMSMHVPYVKYNPITTSDHMSAIGVFGLLQIIAFFTMLKRHLPASDFQRLSNLTMVGSFTIGVAGLAVLKAFNIVAPWTGRFYSLWDTGYAKKHLPIIASVSEHQPTAWGQLFFDMQILIPLLPAGLYFCFKRARQEHILVIVYSLTATYFAAVMVRLILTLAPVLSIAAAIAVSSVLDTFLGKIVRTGAKDGASHDHPKKGIQSRLLSYIVIVPVMYIMTMFVWHCVWTAQHAYSSPSIILAGGKHNGQTVIIDDFRDAYTWLRENTDEGARIMSWWDYGYQLAGMSERTTLVDNNTWNNTHIATVGKAFALRESDVDLQKFDPNALAELSGRGVDVGGSYSVLSRLGADYVLVMYGGALGYQGDDINKLSWIVKIAENLFGNEVQEGLLQNQDGSGIDPGDNGSPHYHRSLMYKLCYKDVYEMYNAGPSAQAAAKQWTEEQMDEIEEEWVDGSESALPFLNSIFQGLDTTTPDRKPAIDRLRNRPVRNKRIQIDTLEEVYTSSRWLVRIFKTKPKDPLFRTHAQARGFERGTSFRQHPFVS